MHTKIIATLGPASQDIETIRELVDAGARIFRLNFSHGDERHFAELVAAIRGLEAETGHTLTLLQDLSGPKIRTGDVGRGTLEIAKGAEVLLGTSDAALGREEPFICLDIPEIVKGLKVGDVVALSDGMLRFSVTGRQGDQVAVMVAETAGIAPPRKGIAFPGKTTLLDALTKKDKQDLKIGMGLGVDAVAMSYVQKPEDIADLKSEMRYLGKTLPIIAKLERRNAFNNLLRILEESDGVMVARGDLGLECDLSELPAMQKRIIGACNAAGKPVIVATQMLLSMVTSPVPTRAETTDVANAILDGADCIMLSEETAIGKYPGKAVRFMRKIADQAEDFLFEDLRPGPHAPGGQEHPAKFLAYAACLLAEKTRSKALVCHSVSGATARTLSACRPRQPIYALSPDGKVRRFTNFSWGVIPAAPPEAADSHLDRAEEFVRLSPAFADQDTVVITAGQPKRDQAYTRTNVVKVYEK
ncbi:MAG: pyruvate kinase [Desulfovibrionaceae bacterium]|nr:pyruvate kinase [Desulfovibrionaceae bacterium]